MCTHSDIYHAMVNGVCRDLITAETVAAENAAAEARIQAQTRRTLAGYLASHYPRWMRETAPEPCTEGPAPFYAHSEFSSLTDD